MHRAVHFLNVHENFYNFHIYILIMIQGTKYAALTWVNSCNCNVIGSMSWDPERELLWQQQKNQQMRRVSVTLTS